MISERNPDGSLASDAAPFSIVETEIEGESISERGILFFLVTRNEYDVADG